MFFSSGNWILRESEKGIVLGVRKISNLRSVNGVVGTDPDQVHQTHSGMLASQAPIAKKKPVGRSLRVERHFD